MTPLFKLLQITEVPMYADEVKIIVCITEGLLQLIISLMYIKNSNGPSTDPCGTPYVTVSLSEFSPSV